MIRFKNNTGGYYSIKLTDYTGVRPEKVFSFPLPTTVLPIPHDYAAGIALDPYAMAAYEAGYFLVVDGKDEFDKLLSESGAISEEQIETIEKNILHDNLLLAALTTGKLETVKEYYNSPNRVRLVQLAIDNSDKITKEKLDYLEQEANISLSYED